MNLQTVWIFLSTQGVGFGLKLLGAIVVWIVRRWLIRWAVQLFGVAMERGKKLDLTLTHYLKSTLTILFTVLLILGILGFFGVNTTSFAALLAGAGVAIGAAWSGMLGNLAAGVFIQVLRPLKVGDFITAGGVTGTVKEIGLFATTVLTMDNVWTMVGNNKLFSDNIQNFSAEPHRRVDCETRLSYAAPLDDAMAKLRVAVAAIPNVKADPAPSVEILKFTPEGPMLCVRPYTHTDHYWQVYFDTYKAIAHTFAQSGYPVPETPMVYRNVPAAQVV